MGTNVSNGGGNIFYNFNPISVDGIEWLPVFIEEHVRWYPGLKSVDRQHEHERAAAIAGYLCAGQNIELAVIM